MAQPAYTDMTFRVAISPPTTWQKEAPHNPAEHSA